MTAPHDQVVVITGATGMLGTAAAAELARRGVDMVLVARDRTRGTALVERLEGAGGSHRLVVGDLSELGSVRDIAAEIGTTHPRLSALVHTAATLTPQRRTNSSGHEVMFVTNVLARFLLTHELAGPLAAGSARVVLATGATPDALDFDDLMATRSWSAFRQFRATSAASHQLALELARRGDAVGIAANAFHPGVLQSGLMRQMPAPVRVLTVPFGRSAGKAASALADLVEDGAPTGAYYRRTKPSAPPKASLDTGSQRRLWAAAATLSGIDVADTIGGTG